MAWRTLADDYNWITPENVDAALDAIEVVVYEQQRSRLPDCQWDILRRAVLFRDGYHCANCNADDKPLDAHHIVPAGSGGSNLMSNLKTLCRECHMLIHPWIKANEHRHTTA